MEKKDNLLLYTHNVTVEKAEGRRGITHKDEKILEISLSSYIFFII